MWLKFFPFLFLLACATAKKTDLPVEQKMENNDKMRLHDIWALKEINREAIPSDLMKRPTLEIFVEESRVLGNDGCNSQAASLKKITENELIFGHFMGTKMACPNMVFSKKYNANLSSTRFYKLEKLELVLLDEQNNELLRFRKVH